MWERERKTNSFGITAIIFKALNPLFKKDFKSTELLTKTSFFLYFIDRPKKTKEAKPIIISHYFSHHSFMISLFLAAPALRVQQGTWNLMKTSVHNEQKLFILFWKRYYCIHKLSFLILTTFSEMFFKLQE